MSQHDESKGFKDNTLEELHEFIDEAEIAAVVNSSETAEARKLGHFKRPQFTHKEKVSIRQVLGLL